MPSLFHAYAPSFPPTLFYSAVWLLTKDLHPPVHKSPRREGPHFSTWNVETLNLAHSSMSPQCYILITECSLYYPPRAFFCFYYYFSLRHNWPSHDNTTSALFFFSPFFLQIIRSRYTMWWFLFFRRRRIAPSCPSPEKKERIFCRTRSAWMYIDIYCINRDRLVVHTVVNKKRLLVDDNIYWMTVLRDPIEKLWWGVEQMKSFNVQSSPTCD